MRRKPAAGEIRPLDLEGAIDQGRRDTYRHPTVKDDSLHGSTRAVGVGPRIQLPLERESCLAFDRLEFEVQHTLSNLALGMQRRIPHDRFHPEKRCELRKPDRRRRQFESSRPVVRLGPGPVCPDLVRRGRDFEFFQGPSAGAAFQHAGAARQRQTRLLQRAAELGHVDAELVRIQRECAFQVEGSDPKRWPTPIRGRSPPGRRGSRGWRGRWSNGCRRPP